jgi:tetratricopeptide (TPR) repeat protein
MNSRINLLLIALFSLLIVAKINAQNGDQEAFKKISSITNPDKQIEALESFTTQFPHSNYLPRAYYYLVNLFANKKDEANAIKYSEKFVNFYPEPARMNAYNTIAYTLAQNKVGLKTAADYAQKAVDMARNSNPRMLNMILDTQALVLYNLGYADSARVLEREAIKGNENDPSYLYYLSLYEEASRHMKDALIHSAKAILYGDPGQAEEKFNEWLKKSKTTEKEQNELKTEIVNNTVDDFLKANKGEDNLLIKSNVAAFTAKMGIDLKKSEKTAIDAVKSAGKNTSLENMLALKSNLAIVYLAMNQNKRAIEELNSVKDIASPYDGDFWFTLGKAYEKSSDKEKAFDSYIQGLIAYENPKIKTEVDNFMAINNIDAKTLQSRINGEKEKMLKFEPGEFKGKDPTGRVVLAELFTGAECPPCVGADMAFDRLSEYYPKNVFAVLEYHVHIPGPDPLTNPQTFERYKYYGGNFGTPTVFFDGGNQLIGGGPDYLMANKFKVYNYIIKQQLAEKPAVKINGTAKVENNKVNVKVKITPVEKLSGQSLHIALAERSVDYTGGNGISKQGFVVRNLVDGPEGSPLTLDGKTVSVQKIIDLASVENTIKTYLDDPAKDPNHSWRGGKADWRARPEKLNPHNLAVVIWVQNNLTKKISQTFYTNVAYEMGSK